MNIKDGELVGGAGLEAQQHFCEEVCLQYTDASSNRRLYSARGCISHSSIAVSEYRCACMTLQQLLLNTCGLSYCLQLHVQEHR
jgi:hypothetical protein